MLTLLAETQKAVKRDASSGSHVQFDGPIWGEFTFPHRIVTCKHDDLAFHRPDFSVSEMPLESKI